MNKKLTCIECPVGCCLSVDIEKCRVIKVDGHKCPKGEIYAVAEVENPIRILTSTVLTIGLNIKMLPVRTDRPMPKSRIFEAMAEVKKIRVKNQISPGDIIVENFLGLGINLVATRGAGKAV